MKIYATRADSNNVQWLIPEVPEEKLLDTLSFDREKKSNEFYEIEWYVYNPKKPKANFYTGANGVLIFDQAVHDSDIFTLFEIAGEIIPLKLQSGGLLYALKCLRMHQYIR